MKLDGWRDKPLHRQYPSRTDKKGVSCWRWLQTGYLKKETEGLLMAVQNQTLVTKTYRVTIWKQRTSKKCRMCNCQEMKLLYISSVNVQSWLRMSIRTTMIWLPLWFTGNYAENMV